MGLNIYFYDGVGDGAKEIEIESHLQITHNLNTVVDELGKLVGKPYYEVIWRLDELFELKNGEVPAEFVLKLLPDLIKNLLKFEDRLVDYLPSNGWGTFESLIDFLCNYLKECYRNKDSFVYCCR